MALAVSSYSLLLLLLSIFVATVVHGKREFVTRIPNGGNVGAIHSLGHISWDGAGPLNDFGKAFAAAGFTWTRSLCNGDADGDGQTNGEELGDPCCLWAANGQAATATHGAASHQNENAAPLAPPPLITDVLSHPGDFGSKLNSTELRLRQLICQALDRVAKTSSLAPGVLIDNGASSQGFGSSGDDSPADWDLKSKHPPAPKDIESSASSSLEVEKSFHLVVWIVVATAIAVVAIM